MFFVVEVMSNGDNKIFYKKMAPIEIRGLLASINKQQKTKNMPFEALSRDKSWIEVELKAFLSDCIKQKSFASKTPFSIEDIKNVHDYQWEFSFQGKKDNLLKDFLGGFKSFLYLKTKEGAVIDMELLGNLSDSITVFGFKRQCFLFSLSTANLCFEVFVHILPTKACQTLTKIV